MREPGIPRRAVLLKAAVIGECAVTCAMARSMGERWAAWIMVALMAVIGIVAGWLASLVVGNPRAGLVGYLVAGLKFRAAQAILPSPAS